MTEAATGTSCPCESWKRNTAVRLVSARGYHLLQDSPGEGNNFYNAPSDVVEYLMAGMAQDELDIRDAARLTGRSAETVRRWVWAGRIRARKSGKRLLVLRGDLEALAGTDRKRLSLREWQAIAHKTLRRPTVGRSASDLVLDDRRERSRESDASR
jgi:excisionase family DNA binding protein